MDDIINRALMYGDHPPTGIFFTVILEYNHTNPAFGGEISAKESLMHTNPIKSFPLAMDAGDMIRDKLLSTKLTGAKCIDVDPMTADGYHLQLVDTNHDLLLRIGIESHDFRHNTIH